MTPYQQLEARFARRGTLNEALSVLNWDYSSMMPAGGAQARAEQMSTLEVMAHEILTAAELPDLLDQAQGQNELSDWQRANLKEMRRDWLHATAVPASLVETLSKASVECEMAWRDARPANDFAGILPKLRTVLELTREVAAAKAAKLDKPLYDALLDAYEPDGSAAEIDRQFAALSAFLPAAITAAIERQQSRPAPIQPQGPFPIERQKLVGLKFMAALGFDFDHGRLDVSAHPFCGGTPDDVRITTRYREDDFARAMMGVLHETGHALYERGLPADWRRQPVGRARGMSLHESQSLLMEMQACRSREFLEFAAPLLSDTFGGSGPAWDADNLYRLNTRVSRSLIRVDADEATYPAHVILRYRLERAMIEDRLQLADLPGAWNDGMRELVGIAPPDDRDGCLQDIHWYCGLWGYFPTYTLGAMTAAQLFQAATAQDASIRPGLAKGDFAPLLGWLRRNVHGRASSVPAAELLTDATGKPLDAEAFQRHLQTRYLSE
ncbi:MAG: Thermostable carboxypeptidase 1 [Rhodospirillales bacterium]|nr:Thermostable carboxypeptidase 1 [Rhodospirillales bacterium]